MRGDKEGKMGAKINGIYMGYTGSVDTLDKCDVSYKSLC